MFKKITISSLLLLTFLGAFVQTHAQTYSPSAHTVVSKPLGVNGIPADARSYYYDATHFVYRPYQSTAEVLTYLSTAKNRTGNFPIYINPTGTINATTGVMTGGSVLEYWFKDGQADANLIQKVSGSTYTYSSPLAVDGNNNVTIQQASTLQPGYLSAADWTTFNGKQAALGFTPENQANKVTSLTNSATDYPSTSAVTAALSPYQTAATADTKYPLLTGSYANPSWIASFPWSKITSTPTMLSGYGITNGQTNTISTKPTSTGSSYSVGDNLEQALANHDNAIATNASAITGKFNNPTGTTAQYIRGDGSLNTFPTNVSYFNNDAAYLTSSGIDPTAYSQPEVGTVINDTFSRASLGSNWTDNSGGTITIVSNKLHLTTASSTSLSKYITYSAYGNSNSEAFTISSTATVGSTNSGDALFYTLQSNAVHNNASFQIGVGVDGYIKYYYNNSITPFLSSTNGMTITTGDVLNVKIKFIRNKILTTVIDQNTGMTNTSEYEFIQTYPVSVMFPNAFRFGIGVIQGTFDVTLFKVDRNENKSPTYFVIGDSITRGLFTDNAFDKWIELVSNYANVTTLLNATAGQSIDDVNLSEILATQASTIVLSIGTNNIASDGTSTTETKYANLVNSLTSNGYTVGTNLFICLLTPRSDNSTYKTAVQTFNSWLLSTYGYQNCIDFYTPMADGSGNPLYAPFDSLHPSNEGHKVMSNQFIAFFNPKSKAKKIGNYFPLILSPNGWAMLGDKNYKSLTPRYALDIANSTGAAQIHAAFGASDNGLYAGSAGSNNFFLLGGAAYNGSNYVAKDTYMGAVTSYNGGLTFYGQSGLSVGGSFTPTQRAAMDNTGKWAFGSQSATDLVDFQGGTSTYAQFRFRSGSLPSSLNDGAGGYDGTHLYIQLGGAKRQIDQQNVNVIATATDANYTITTANQYVELPTITAARTASLPTASSYAGMTIKVIVTNTASGFQWSFPASTVYDASGNAITALTNGTTYYLESNGSLWRKISAN
jgi:lysophospholipase L1-like esterase